MNRRKVSLASVLLCLSGAACAVEGEEDVTAIAQAIESDPTQVISPAISVPTLQLLPLKTISVWDFYGRKDSVSVWSGNAQTATSKLSYAVSAPGGTYTLSFRHEGLNRIIVEAVRSTANGPVVVGKMTNERHVGTTLEYMGDPVAAGAVMGPFVVNFANVMYDINMYLLLDHQVLGFLPKPNRVDGAPISGDAAKQATADSFYKSLVSNYATLWQASKFRFDITALGAADRAALVPIMQTYINTDENWHRHMEINHSVAIAAPVADSDPHNSIYALGGFFNGHRTYMGQMEAYFKQDSVPLDYVLPFRRLPVWRPNTTIPAEFQVLINDSTPQVAIPASLSYGPTICGNYATATELHSKSVSGSTLNGWHGSVHNAVGGTFGVAHDAAKAPLFWSWHTTVDTFWANWQHCRKPFIVLIDPTLVDLL